MSRIICPLIALLFAISTAVMAYLFLWKGDTQPTEDGRTAILLNSSERALVLGEMRDFLVAVQAVLDAANRDDPSAAAPAARRVGMAAQQAVPATLVGKLPAEFKTLGFDTHRQFDQLALDAEQLGDPDHTRQQLAALMNNCLACHAAYRIDATQAGTKP